MPLTLPCGWRSYRLQHIHALKRLWRAVLRRGLFMVGRAADGGSPAACSSACALCVACPAALSSALLRVSAYWRCAACAVVSLCLPRLPACLLLLPYHCPAYQPLHPHLSTLFPFTYMPVPALAFGYVPVGGQDGLLLLHPACTACLPSLPFYPLMLFLYMASLDGGSVLPLAAAGSEASGVAGRKERRRLLLLRALCARWGSWVTVCPSSSGATSAGASNAATSCLYRSFSTVFGNFCSLRAAVPLCHFANRFRPLLRSRRNGFQTTCRLPPSVAYQASPLLPVSLTWKTGCGGGAVA